MVKLKRQVMGLSQLESKLKRIARAVSPQGHLADALADGATPVLEEARENILELQLWQSGDLYDSGKVVKVNQFRVDVEFRVVYAAIHEYGGTIKVPVTAKSRAYFWWRHRVTGDDKWKAMALSKKSHFIVKIPARPYLRPAVQSTKDDVATFVAKSLRPHIVRAAT